MVYLLIFREGEGRERNISVQEIHRSVTSHLPPAGDLAGNPGICPDWESNARPLSSQAAAQSTEPHQPGPELFLDTSWRPLSTRLKVCTGL